MLSWPAEMLISNPGHLEATLEDFLLIDKYIRIETEIQSAIRSSQAENGKDVTQWPNSVGFAIAGRNHVQ